MNYKQQALRYYKNHPKREKALATGIALDNALVKDKPHFMMGNYLRYFEYNVLKNRGLI